MISRREFLAGSVGFLAASSSARRQVEPKPILVNDILAWAKQAYACTVFNLHTVHSPEGLEGSQAAFRRLIDMAARRGGTYYLTYHRYATRQQVESCYPQFKEFLELKRKYDPEERFQSDWYRHYRVMFA
jgi:FAD/FMN-containing dehydrogenase